MKNLVILLVTVFAFTLSTVNAQQTATAETVAYTNTTDGEVEILTNFTANKTQKKVIKKIQKYVTPRIFGRTANSSAMANKAVRVQLNFDGAGAITHITMVDGVAPKLDNKVIALIKEFDTKEPISGTDLERPTAIQFDVNLAGRKYFVTQ